MSLGPGLIWSSHLLMMSASKMLLWLFKTFNPVVGRTFCKVSDWRLSWWALTCLNLRKIQVNFFIFFSKWTYPGDTKEALRSSSQTTTCPFVYHTPWRPHIVPFHCWPSSREAVNRLSWLWTWSEMSKLFWRRAKQNIRNVFLKRWENYN